MDNNEKISNEICGMGFLKTFSGDTAAVWAKSPGLVSYDTVVGWYTGPLAGILQTISSLLPV